MPTPTAILERVAALVDAWCERRCLRPLREILGAWPMTTGLTDEWGALAHALERVRALAASDLTEDEILRVEAALHDVEQLLVRGLPAEPAAEGEEPREDAHADASLALSEALWQLVAPHVAPGLVEALRVGTGGKLEVRLAREPSAEEGEVLDRVLRQAMATLFTRPPQPPS